MQLGGIQLLQVDLVVKLLVTDQLLVAVSAMLLKVSAQLLQEDY